MGLPGAMQSGRSGMMAAQTAIATSGHNISNANTEGYNRQRVETTTAEPRKGPGNLFVGRGTQVSRVERINDNYLEKHIRDGARDMAGFEEKDVMLNQLEDVFNELNGDGLNRLVARFFNEFRKLSNDPDSEAVRQSLREATNALSNDFKRIRRGITGIQEHIDNRIEGYSTQVNAFAEQIKDLNIKIKVLEQNGGSPNDLLDQRDEALKNLSELVNVSMHTDKEGSYIVNVRNIGPLVTGPVAERFSVMRTPADDQGKPENSYDVRTSATAAGPVTHFLRGAKMGSLLEIRDSTLSEALNRLDNLAFTMGNAVNQVHAQGFTRSGATGVAYFKPLTGKERAAELLQLSDEIVDNVNNIAASGTPESAGDNRVAVAISGLQNLRLLNEGRATVDDFYNSMVSEVGVVRAKNGQAMKQQSSIMGQLSKMREQISGVSLDEETANLMKYQHAFDASAKVIAVADEMLDTVLSLKRM
ncbi:MAG: flagellar hook-associated protein FlgK [Bdellovibrionales bacterium]|nr:flagellar hook-associated protein FlgK [Bdellovibrionales bacterium]